MSVELTLFDVDLSDFKSWLISHVLTLNPTYPQIQPVRFDNELISIAGWKINVRARIYETATTDVVIHGWNMILQFLNEQDAQTLLTFVFRSLVMDYIIPRYY